MSSTAERKHREMNANGREGGEKDMEGDRSGEKGTEGSRGERGRGRRKAWMVAVAGTPVIFAPGATTTVVTVLDMTSLSYMFPCTQ